MLGILARAQLDEMSVCGISTRIPLTFLTVEWQNFRKEHSQNKAKQSKANTTKVDMHGIFMTYPWKYKDLSVLWAHPTFGRGACTCQPQFKGGDLGFATRWPAVRRVCKMTWQWSSLGKTVGLSVHSPQSFCRWRM